MSYLKSHVSRSVLFSVSRPLPESIEHDMFSTISSHVYIGHLAKVSHNTTPREHCSARRKLGLRCICPQALCFVSTGTRAKLRVYDSPLSICAHAHVLGIEVEAQRQLSPSLANFTCYPVSLVREGLRALVAKENPPLSESTDLKCPRKAKHTPPS